MISIPRSTARFKSVGWRLPAFAAKSQLIRFNGATNKVPVHVSEQSARLVKSRDHSRPTVGRSQERLSETLLLRESTCVPRPELAIILCSCARAHASVYRAIGAVQIPREKCSERNMKGERKREEKESRLIVAARDTTRLLWQTAELGGIKSGIAIPR